MRQYLASLFFLVSLIATAQSQPENIDETKEKIKEMASIIASEPTAENYYSRGFMSYNVGDYRNALADYDLAIKMLPEEFDYYYSRGMLKDKINDFNGAADDYTVCIMLNGTSAKAYFNRAFTKSKLNDYYGAITDYTECIKINPKHFNAYQNRGIARQRQQLHEEAISDFTAVIHINPKFYEAVLSRALSKAILNLSGALDDFNLAIAMEPNDPELYYNRALYFINYKIKSDYCADLKKALQRGLQRSQELIKKHCK